MKSKGVAYLLWFFLGIIGVHKFYIHKWGMGVMYIIFLITGIFFWVPFFLLGIGWLIDLFILGSQVDAYNLAKANKTLQKETSALAQNTVNLANQVSTNQGMQYGTLMTNNFSSGVQPVEQSAVNNPKIEKLRNLKSLLDSGILTQEEFEIEKQKILNS